MSEHDGDDPYRSDPNRTDPYRTPGPRSGEPDLTGPPYPQPYPQQPYPQQPYPQQPSGAPGGATLPEKPPSVVRLRQVMLAGAVVALLQGVYAAFVVDDVLGASSADLDQVAAQADLDPAQLADIAGTVALVVLAVLTLVTVGLWLLFARLFDRGTGRVVGTVLGGLNAASGVFALAQPTDLGEWALAALTMALVVAGLVLLWRPATSAWFSAVAASKRQAWG